MKNLPILLVSTFFFLLIAPSYGQNEKEARLNIIRAGWNYSQYFNGNDALTGTTHYSSFYVGFAREVKIIPLLLFGSGAEYLQNGGKIDDNNKRILHYIGVPLYLKLKLGPVYALTGFELSFKVAEQAYLLGQKYTPLEKANWFDAPFFLGAGVQIFIFAVELRYHWGTIAAYSSGETEVKSQYLQLGATISF